MNSRWLTCCLFVTLVSFSPCKAQEGQQPPGKSLFIDQSAVEPDRVQRVKEQLEHLLPGITIKAESVARSMYPLIQPTRYLVIKWEAYLDAPEMICFTEVERYRKGTKLETVKEERREKGGWAGRRYLAREAFQLFAVAVGPDNNLIWWGELYDYRITHPPIPLPGSTNVCAELYITKPEIFVEVPDDKRIKELRFYENSRVGAGWDEVGRIAL